MKSSENHNIIDELQSGFRKNHLTIDNIFILQAIIQKYISNIFLNHVVEFSLFSLTFKKLSIASSMTNYGLLQRGKTLTGKY